jgi:hypothetical protein
VHDLVDEELGQHPDTGVVDEQVDTPEALPYLRDPGGDGALVSDVEREAESAWAQIGGCAAGALRVTTRDCYARAWGPRAPGPLPARDRWWRR